MYKAFSCIQEIYENKDVLKSMQLSSCDSLDYYWLPYVMEKLSNKHLFIRRGLINLKNDFYTVTKGSSRT